jgi:hypothetical protein
LGKLEELTGLRFEYSGLRFGSSGLLFFPKCRLKKNGRVLSIPRINEQNTVKNTGTDLITVKPKLISHFLSRLNIINRRITAEKTII